MGELVGALIGTFLLTRLCAWSFKPSANRAMIAAGAVFVLALVIWPAGESSVDPAHATVAYAATLYGPCLLLWLIIDLVRDSGRLREIEARQAKREREEEDRRWRDDLAARRPATRSRSSPPTPAKRTTPERIKTEEPTRVLDQSTPAQEVAEAPRTCQACGASTPAGATFCDACGARLGGCPKCGATNRAEARFCKQCGASLTAGTTPEAPPPEK